ncbi:hypothetical protein RJZ90_006980 [Blastomyces dermatitidis]
MSWFSGGLGYFKHHLDLRQNINQSPLLTADCNSETSQALSFHATITHEDFDFIAKTWKMAVAMALSSGTPSSRAGLDGKRAKRKLVGIVSTKKPAETLHLGEIMQQSISLLDIFCRFSSISLGLKSCSGKGKGGCGHVRVRAFWFLSTLLVGWRGDAKVVAPYNSPE